RRTIAARLRQAAAPVRDLLRRAALLLGEQDPVGREARRRGLELLARRRRAADWVSWTPVPVAEWPLWEADRARPEERLLSLGLYVEARDALVRHFPTSRPRLAFTGAARLLEREAGVRRAVAIAEALFENLPREVPAEWVAPELRRMLHPYPWAALIRAQASAYRIDPALLAALIREESRFDPGAVSPAAARGLAQLTRPTAGRLAGAIGLREPEPRDLLRPDLSIALGAAHLAELSRQFPAAEMVVVAAYNAGSDQAALWRRACATREPEEYLAKIGFRETRAYVIRVFESRAIYRALYGTRPD
ncbi:MAG: lytic transglycosylase domain-containing protein, partial [Thermoanaerobaculia bacterium]